MEMFLTIKLCTNAKLNCFSIEQIICIKMDLALNNLQRLICHKTKQTKPNQSTSLSSQTTRYCLVNVEGDRQKYFDVKLFVLPDLCAVVFLGQDFMGNKNLLLLK